MKSISETKHFEVISDNLCFSPKDYSSKYTMVIRFKEENLPSCENVEGPYPPVIALGEILDHLGIKLSLSKTDLTEIKLTNSELGLGATSGRKQWQRITESWMAYRIEKDMGQNIERCWRTREIFRCHFELELTHEETEKKS